MNGGLEAGLTREAPAFFGLVLALSLPFYLLGLWHLPLPGLPNLPASALMAFMPMAAALILVYRDRGRGGIVALVLRLTHFGPAARIGWHLAALLIMPAVCAVEFGVLRLTGSDLPLPQIAPGAVLFMFIAFCIGAIGEELGWQGYAYPALRQRHNALMAALVLGVVWALWHVIPYGLMGRSAEWILWHSLSAVAMRIIIVWLFENTRGSIPVAVLFHTMINLSWALFPVDGSYYDPFITFVILTMAAAVIVYLWGPATLAGFRAGKGR